MPRKVLYRDLPGGPKLIEFSDEIPRKDTCTGCAMISLDLYVDPKRHIFCRVCLDAASERRHIFCKLENQDVPLDRCIEAYEALTILRKMTVFCPNKEEGCEDTAKLEAVRDHYMKCKFTEIDCSGCNARIPGAIYSIHFESCAPIIIQCPCCYSRMKKTALPQHRCSKRRDNTFFETSPPVPSIEPYPLSNSSAQEEEEMETAFRLGVSVDLAEDKDAEGRALLRPLDNGSSSTPALPTRFIGLISDTIPFATGLGTMIWRQVYVVISETLRLCASALNWTLPRNLARAVPSLLELCVFLLLFRK